MAPAQVKNSYSNIGQLDTDISPSTLQLRLSVTQTALRYFVRSETHGQLIFFGDYTLHHVNNEAELAQRVEKIIEKDEILQLPYSKVLIGFDEKYSLVPVELAFMINPSEQLTQKCGSVQLVFSKPQQLSNSLSRFFSQPFFLHLNSTYFNLANEKAGKSEGCIFVNVGRQHLDVILFDENGRLKLMNRFGYQAASDFIYFLLLCCEELKIDRDKTELVLLGEVNVQSKIYELCYRYFANISFLQPAGEVEFSKAFAEYPKHLHFNLYNLNE